MRKLLIGIVALLAVGAAGYYALWTQQRPAGHYLSDLRIQLDVNEGTPGENGNLLGVQPELYPTDYQTPERLQRKLQAYLEQARDLGLLNARTVVVLPEHIGTWLWATDEKDELYQAAAQQEANSWLAASNPLNFAGALFAAKGEDRLRDAYLRTKAQVMVAQYQELFGGLAETFGVTVVGGSIVLPNPVVADGQLRTRSGPLYNVSVVFGANGAPLGQPQRQHFPSYAARSYIAPADGPDFSVVDTPAGRLGVLIGADSWYPANYAQLDKQAVQLIAVPASVNGRGVWASPWRGYTGLSTPNEVSLKPGEVSEGDAWHRLTLAGKAPSSAAVAGVSVFMHGQFWEQASEGQSFISHLGETHGAAEGRGARLINVWL
jgi:predicted amidohydrolase